jgi:UDP-glucuronate 4-epimerase
MAYYSFTRAISEGQPIDVYNHGRMQRDFTYIDDVIIAVERLLERPPAAVGADDQKLTPHTIYNIGNHTPIELSRFIAAIESALSMQAEKHYLPMQPGDVSVTYADVQRLSEVTGFAPQTTIEDGISRFVEWYRTHHGDTRAAL